MTKQKHTVSSGLSYTQLNQQFPYRPKQKYTSFNGLKPFGDYMIGPVTGFTQVVETDFLHFVFWEKPLKGKASEFGKWAKKFKFHISLPEWDKASFIKGCNIVIRCLVERHISGFKVIRNNLKMSDQLGQGGKDITIYVHYNSILSINDWVNVLNTITQELAQAKIKPGYRILSSYITTFKNFDKHGGESRIQTVLEKPEHVTHSPYVYYRFDESHGRNSNKFKSALRKINSLSNKGLVASKQYKNIDEVLNRDYTVGGHVRSVNTP